MIKFHSEPWLNACEWRMIFSGANNRHAVSTQGRIDVHARHTFPKAFHTLVMLRYSWRSFGIDTHHFPCLGRSESPACLQPSPFPNHIITALKADRWQKAPRKWARWAFCGSYYLITLFSCEMLGVCLCRAIIYLAGVCHHNYPPETQNWSGCRTNRGHSKGGEREQP